MGSRYLTDLADVVRDAALVCAEYPGWQTRARSSGGYNTDCPTHVMVHHTASPSSWDGQRDADYIATGDPAAPLANLYIDRSGLVWVIAAGATNTNGKGHDWWGGGVPDNSMNSYAIGIEAGNNGTGEPWPPDQLAAYRTLVGALCAGYRIENRCVRGHFEWTTRKIDPAGSSPYATGGASWDMDTFRADCCLAPAPSPEDDHPMPFLILAGPHWWVSDLASYRTYVNSPDAGRAGVAQFGWRAGPDGNPIPLPTVLNQLWNSLPQNGKP